jgi:hypothetical protein
MAADTDDIRGRLEAIADELGELALGTLRRAVEKAAALLADRGTT